MTLHARDAGQNTISKVRVRDASNALVEIGAMRVRSADGLSNILANLAVNAPYEVDGFGYSFKPVGLQVTTDTATAIASGGTAPYTYSWTVADEGWAALSPTSASCSFRSPMIAAGATKTTTATCTVTDAMGATASADVFAVCTNNAGG